MAALRIDRDHYALGAEDPGEPADRSGRASAEELTETLSAPASRTAWASATDRMPPPIVNGMKTLSAVRRASATIVSRRSCEAVMSRKTSSSALGVVALGELTGSPGVVQADEVGS